MEWVSILEVKRTDPIFPHSISSPPPPSSSTGIDSKINPSVLLIIVILAVVFFLSGLLHLLVRYLLRPVRRNPEDPYDVTALQGQLQQLFHLHDAGVDQSVIDTLLFHSTCPLCRSSLLADFPASCSPFVLVLESGGEISREIAIPESNPQSGPHLEEDPGQPANDHPREAGETVAKEAEPSPPDAPNPPERVVPVKLGKFRNVGVPGVDGGEAHRGEEDGGGRVRAGVEQRLHGEDEQCRVALFIFSGGKREKPQYNFGRNGQGGGRSSAERSQLSY